MTPEEAHNDCSSRERKETRNGKKGGVDDLYMTLNGKQSTVLVCECIMRYVPLQCFAFENPEIGGAYPLSQFDNAHIDRLVQFLVSKYSYQSV